MRALIITAVLAVLGIGGYLLYRSSQPASDAKLFESQAPAAPPAAGPEDCPAQFALYEFQEDRRLLLRFRSTNSASAGTATVGGSAIDVSAGRTSGDLDFVFHVSTIGLDVVFTQVPPNNAPAPKYQQMLNLMRPAEGGQTVEYALFDSNMRYLTELPRTDTPSPAFIYAPNMMRAMYPHRVDLGLGMFKFLRCDEPRAPSTPAPAE